ncbi:molecular chaperone SurA [Thiohalocapsa marina]|uniref:Chaperone SurA n=1 Tax=Thiohalocapsa marina TaxID=424902 RepID=A0A5M8FAK8_9GAMM|nr:peptidylprolyl isomerase [Thiohalocapsa marina]KAA6181878.1 molecular chaperone SurA [Thiohalocapsa marina]
MAIRPTSRRRRPLQPAPLPRLLTRLLPLLLLAPALWLPGAGMAQIQPLDRIVAVVNDDVIVQSELEDEIALLLPELQARGAAIPSPEMLEEQVLERLILKRLQVQRAAQLGIEVDETTLTAAMTNIAARNGLSLEQLRDTLEAGGVSFDDFREDTRMQILTSRLQQQEVIKNIRVSDAEVDRFMEQEGDSLIERRAVRLQHLLVALPDDPSEAQVDAARRTSEGLLGRIRGGESFADVAAAHSDGRRAQEGGDLGWFPMAEVPSLALEPAQSLARGAVSEPIRSPSGFHLIRIADIESDAPEPVSQTHARHILIRTSEVVSDTDAQRRLQQLRLRILGGDDFSTLARAHSDDTGSALKGGDLGWVSPGDTVPEFEEEMDKLAPNALSQPFQSPFGWHLVQVLERRQQDTADSLLRLKAEEVLRERKGEEATEAWLQQLRDEAYVELRLDDASAY